MGEFKETLKLEVKRKAHFKCCICESFDFLHVHHITPQEKGGPETIDNAAPLCTRCHDLYGDNPKKKKWITEKRDFWFDFCEKRLYNEDINALEKTYKIIEELYTKHEERLKTAEEEIRTLQKTVEELTSQNQRLINVLPTTPIEDRPEIFAQIGSNASTISGTVSAMTASLKCPNCGYIGLPNEEAPSICPYCKKPMHSFITFI